MMVDINDRKFVLTPKSNKNLIYVCFMLQKWYMSPKLNHPSTKIDGACYSFVEGDFSLESSSFNVIGHTILNAC